MSLLHIKNLHIGFNPQQPAVVRNVNFSLDAGETLALVGESGCGKSVTALSIMGLLEKPGRITQGSIQFDGQELTQLPEKAYQQLRGKRISMVFQEPMTSLNPVFTIGHQISEVLLRHQHCNKKQARQETLSLLEKVGIAMADKRIDQYPHELSGGMKQRVMIAMALACKPEVLIADEPTTALDVTIQAQILELLKDLQAEMSMAILLITHNLGVVAHFAKQVMVMYAGEVVESATVQALFKNPQHPYSKALLNSLPRPGQAVLEPIEGTVPRPSEYPTGCRFCTRCAVKLEKCAAQVPETVQISAQQRVACWHLS